MSLNIINLNIKNLVKLFRQGKITKLYLEMYKLAESLAIHEMEKKGNLIKRKLSKDLSAEEHFTKIIQGMNEYREKRITYHLDEMKQLLELSLKEQK